jgi:hypothetical protein
MRFPVLLALCFIVAGCSSSNDRFNRGYVISKSQVDTEKEAPQPVEGENH